MASTVDDQLCDYEWTPSWDGGQARTLIPGSPDLYFAADICGPEWELRIVADGTVPGSAWLEEAGQAYFFDALGRIEGDPIDLHFDRVTKIPAPDFQPTGIEWRPDGSDHAKSRVWLGRPSDSKVELGRAEFRDGLHLWRARVFASYRAIDVELSMEWLKEQPIYWLPNSPTSTCHGNDSSVWVATLGEELESFASGGVACGAGRQGPLSKEEVRFSQITKGAKRYFQMGFSDPGWWSVDEKLENVDLRNSVRISFCREIGTPGTAMPKNFEHLGLDTRMVVDWSAEDGLKIQFGGAPSSSEEPPPPVFPLAEDEEG